MDEINSLILSIPSTNYRIGTMIITEIDDFNWLDTLDKILAYWPNFKKTIIKKQRNSMLKKGTKQKDIAEVFDISKYAVDRISSFYK